MSALIIITHEFAPQRGGIAVYTEETARAAAALGWQTEVWAPADSSLDTRTFPFTIRQLPIKGNLNWPDRKRTMAAMIAEAPRLQEAHVILIEPGPILAAMYLNAMGKLPLRRFSLVLHGSEILRCARLPHRRTLFGALLYRAETIGVVSRFTRHLLLRYYPLSERKCRVVPGGLRSDFQPQPLAPPADTCTVLSLGRIHPRKGQHCLLEAAALLPEDLRARLHLRFVGPIGHQGYLARLRSLALASRLEVEFTGTVPDDALPTLYAQSSLFAMTSLRSGPSVEGFGLVCIEAGASGLPVIVHRSGGLPEAVRHGITGLVVSPRRRADLAEALARIASDPDLRQRLGEAGRARARELSWTGNLQTLIPHFPTTTQASEE